MQYWMVTLSALAAAAIECSHAEPAVTSLLMMLMLSHTVINHSCSYTCMPHSTALAIKYRNTSCLTGRAKSTSGSAMKDCANCRRLM